MKKLVLKYTLQNAVFYNGKADSKAVLGKVMAENPGMRKNIKAIREEIEKTVSIVNKLKPEKQKKMLLEMDPKLLEKETKKQEGLSPLKGAVMGNVVTRFAPSPTGPLNISQFLRAVMLNYLYARKYKGIFILRIEDTDPSKIEKEFYNMIKEDLINAGIKWDRFYLESDDMSEYYRNAETLIRENHAYVCTCNAEDFRKLKSEGKECPCRSRSNNMEEWNSMLTGKYREGEAVLRLKTSMHDPNPAFRDPPLLRIIESPHPLKGKKYRVWPLYNYANTIEDYNQGVTHVFRGKEHEHNTEIQKRIYNALKWEPPITINFGMINLPGKKIHTRDIKEWIKSKKVSGWDDVRLHTLRALIRRGFHPDALKQYALHCALTKHDITLNWETLETLNRKIIDPVANRYMVVINPVKISISNAPKIKQVSFYLHPDYPKRGKRTVPVNPDSFYISGEDFKTMKNKEIRLKGYGNIILQNQSRYSEDIIKKDMQKIQWVSEPNIKVKILMPEKTTEGLGEPSLKSLKKNDVIQLERIGFVRVDNIETNKITFCFAHK